MKSNDEPTDEALAAATEKLKKLLADDHVKLVRAVAETDGLASCDKTEHQVTLKMSDRDVQMLRHFLASGQDTLQSYQKRHMLMMLAAISQNVVGVAEDEVDVNVNIGLMNKIMDRMKEMLESMERMIKSYEEQVHKDSKPEPPKKSDKPDKDKKVEVTQVKFKTDKEIKSLPKGNEEDYTIANMFKEIIKRDMGKSSLN